jgi:hypothetical protein
MCSFKLIKVHFLVGELYIYIYQNARCNDKKNTKNKSCIKLVRGVFNKGLLKLFLQEK